MTTQSNTASQHPPDAQEIAPAAVSPTRPLYWSVRRELWENRSIYIAPLAVAAVYMLGFLISLFWMPRSLRGLEALHDATPQPIALAMPYSHAAMLIMVVGFLVGIFYSLDALHGERRDRSILFWKSLPVSDLTTVLAKASVPLVILPVLVFAITVTLQLIMLLVNGAVLLLSGAGAATPWHPPLFEMELVLLYSLIVLALWHAPFICGCCWFQAGRGERPFYGPCCRRWRWQRSSSSRFTLRISARCCKTDCMDSPRPLSISRIRLAFLSIRILFRWPNLLQEGSSAVRVYGSGWWSRQYSSPQRCGCAAIKERSDFARS